MRIIIGFVGALFCLYGAACLWTNRINIGIAVFLGIGIFLVLVAKYYASVQQFFQKRRRIQAIFILLVAIGMGSAAFFEASILWGMKGQRPIHIDYIVILGAGVKNGIPTPVLKTRLQKGIEVHQQYPEAKIFVTGGLDTGEKQTEAEVMKDFLVQHGVNANLIVLEDRATSTQENFEYTKALMSIPHPEIIVVTSDYHLYRAKYYAKKAGFQPYSAGAPIPMSIIPLTHLREILAVGYMLARDGIMAS